MARSSGQIIDEKMQDGNTEPGKDEDHTRSEESMVGLRRWWKVYRALFLESTVSTKG